MKKALLEVLNIAELMDEASEEVIEWRNNVMRSSGRSVEGFGRSVAWRSLWRRMLEKG